MEIPIGDLEGDLEGLIVYGECKSSLRQRGSGRIVSLTEDDGGMIQKIAEEYLSYSVVWRVYLKKGNRNELSS